ncbi:putative secondary metabolism biosynthetic enzyme [Diaporthe australafricana]|uniref:Secondary metabolism biosynthetic enzyme n=1 Tax=Diaporthe australafricana TaxID=127596 RepID=A0ABR3W2X5_9PEZI
MSASEHIKQADHLATYPALTDSIRKIDLSKSSVVITGGGQGLGSSIASSFAECGTCRIILVGRSAGPLKETADTINARFSDVTVEACAADISSEDDVRGLFDRLGGRLDILVNNAAYLPELKTFMDLDLLDLKKGLLTNVYGTALVTQSFLRYRAAHHKPGSSPAIVLTVNTAGAFSIRYPCLSAYTSSKAALVRWSELASVDVPEGVARFISVHPGAVRTQMAAKFGLGDSFAFTEGRLVGDFLVWLTGDSAAFLNGRFVSAKWDIDGLVSRKEDIVSQNLLRTSLQGFDDFAQQKLA